MPLEGLAQMRFVAQVRFQSSGEPFTQSRPMMSNRAPWGITVGDVPLLWRKELFTKGNEGNEAKPFLRDDAPARGLEEFYHHGNDPFHQSESKGIISKDCANGMQLMLGNFIDFRAGQGCKHGRIIVIDAVHAFRGD